jgi:hypothetical protein
MADAIGTTRGKKKRRGWFREHRGPRPEVLDEAPGQRKHQGVYVLILHFGYPMMIGTTPDVPGVQIPARQ